MNVESPESVARRQGRSGAWIALVIGGGLSLCVHLALWIILSLMSVDVGGAGNGGRFEATEIELAILTESELAELSNDSVSSASSAVAEAIDAPDLEIEIDIAPFGETLDGLSDAETLFDVPVGGGDLSSGSLEGAAGGALGDSAASFFGVEAQGSRFAYIVDVSGSMKGVDAQGQTRWQRTAAELAGSVQGLPVTGEYTIVLYSDGHYPLVGANPLWVKATERAVRATRRQLARVEPNGGTYPLSAFEAVLSMRTKPDAVYFMTDGEFDGSIPAAVAQLNREATVPIHCILFNDADFDTLRRSPVADLMRAISQRSGGTFAIAGRGR